MSATRGKKKGKIRPSVSSLLRRRALKEDLGDSNSSDSDNMPSQPLLCDSMSSEAMNAIDKGPTQCEASGVSQDTGKQDSPSALVLSQGSKDVYLTPCGSTVVDMENVEVEFSQDLISSPAKSEAYSTQAMMNFNATTEVEESSSEEDERAKKAEAWFNELLPMRILSYGSSKSGPLSGFIGLLEEEAKKENSNVTVNLYESDNEEGVRIKQMLFCDDAAVPSEFTMIPCKERKSVKTMIEELGGTMVSKPGPYTIKLGIPGQKYTATNEDVFSYEFLQACMDKEDFVDLLPYRLNEESIYGDKYEPIWVLVRKKTWDQIKMEVDKENSNDEGMGLKKKKPVTAPQMAKRSYCQKERLTILDYICKTESYDKVKGVILWQRMEHKKVCLGRSWQSMKEHYIKHIIPNIQNFQLSEKQIKLIQEGFKSPWEPSSKSHKSDARVEGREKTEQERQKPLKNGDSKHGEVKNRDSKDGEVKSRDSKHGEVQNRDSNKKKGGKSLSNEENTAKTDRRSCDESTKNAGIGAESLDLFTDEDARKLVKCPEEAQEEAIRDTQETNLSEAFADLNNVPTSTQVSRGAEGPSPARDIEKVLEDIFGDGTPLPTTEPAVNGKTANKDNAVASDAETISVHSDSEVPELDERKKPYTKSEDQEILNFIVDNKQSDNVGGNDLWKLMEKKQVVSNRTWQSLRERFKKAIGPNLDTFRIDPNAKAKLKRRLQKNKKVVHNRGKKEPKPVPVLKTPKKRSLLRDSRVSLLDMEAEEN